ncbi:MAG: glycosyltransferase, partial [Bacteriovoracaceae bacterium]
LSIKSFKKSLFLFFTRAFAPFRSVKFQATSQDEKEEIQSLFSNSVVVAKNYSSFKVSPEQTSKQTWEEGSLKIIFLSRICKKKNLLYAVEVLQNVKANIEFDIYGTLEEPEYLDICLMTNKSPNIKVTYKGEVGSDQVFPTLKDYHLFFLPTLGENFGHVILEALASGVPALVSDKTYFRNLADQLMGFDLSFDRPDEFSKAIDSFSHFEEAEFRKWSQSAHKYGMNYLKSIVHDQSYIELFG